MYTKTPSNTSPCSRLKPSYEFHTEGSQILALQLKGWFKSKMSIQEYRNEIQIRLNLCMNYMVHASNTIWRIKNQPSNSTSCSDNALRLLVLMAVSQVSKMPFQSVNSTPNPFRLTLIKASSMSRLSLVLLLLLTQFCFEKHAHKQQC